MATDKVTSRLPEFLEKIERELDRAMEFWLTHSHDEENGGYFTCLGRDGKVYDDLKYGWLQGRQVWMYSKLYNEVERFHRADILEAAVKGAEFLMKNLRDPETMKCYFLVTKEGKPIKIQRTIFAECFYMLAMSEVARATKDLKYKEEAVKMLRKIQYWVQTDDTELGRPKLSGMTPVNGLAIPMMLLVLVDELSHDDISLAAEFRELQEWTVEQALQHIQRDGTVILESVSVEGKELPGCQGRHMNPGHAIEAGWFLLDYAVKNNRPELKDTAIQKFIVNPFKTGWDEKHGGILYFLDVDGLSPTQLEWNMKLWWPHNEALIAFLMAYKETGDVTYLEYFAQVFDYCFQHFTDDKYGEWYGYLSQQGEVTQDFKGGPFKGCFHVPRSLFMCEKMLKEMLKTQQNGVVNH
ncbi:N-acylglucosamine 2-epimerase-like [Ptychodera flava]|uniref:N-acylglucosamine 2-epimerase-like n=1 Tax=Ptychodera flava TaxID=63121 RepID=UPI00396A0439